MIASKTSQNILAGGMITVAGLLTAFKTLRSFIGEDKLWDVSMDESIATFATVVLLPLVSRKIAFFRNPEKKK